MCDNTKFVGGRESGAKDTGISTHREVDRGNASKPNAVANPAAHILHNPVACTDCRKREERIRELEAEIKRLKAAQFLNDFEKEHPGETRRILEKAWEIQQRTGKSVNIDQLYEELGGLL